MASVIKSNGRLALCRTLSSEAINQLHQSIDGAFANELLLDESRIREPSKQTVLKITHFEDVPRRFVIIADKKSH